MPARRYGRYTVQPTNTGKLMYPEGVTKGEVFEYYESVSDLMLPHLRDRPLTLRRFPDGIEENGFYQKRADSGMPDWIERVQVESEDGPLEQVVCRNLATLMFLANYGTLEFHPWLSRTNDLQTPDLAIIDLDPSPEQDFAAVRRAALLARDLLEELDFRCYVKTTGSKGLHVVLPLRQEQPFDEVKEFMGLVAETLTARHPDLLTTRVRKNARHGRLFVDILRNNYAQTAVAPYSLRALPGAPIAMPMTWDSVEELPGANVATIENASRWLDERDPWLRLSSRKQSLASRRGALEQLHREATESGAER